MPGMPSLLKPGLCSGAAKGTHSELKCERRGTRFPGPVTPLQRQTAPLPRGDQPRGKGRVSFVICCDGWNGGSWLPFKVVCSPPLDLPPQPPHPRDPKTNAWGLVLSWGSLGIIPQSTRIFPKRRSARERSRRHPSPDPSVLPPCAQVGRTPSYSEPGLFRSSG